jgi:hypothetical protein
MQKAVPLALLGEDAVPAAHVPTHVPTFVCIPVMLPAGASVVQQSATTSMDRSLLSKKKQTKHDPHAPKHEPPAPKKSKSTHLDWHCTAAAARSSRETSTRALPTQQQPHPSNCTTSPTEHGLHILLAAESHIAVRTDPQHIGTLFAAAHINYISIVTHCCLLTNVCAVAAAAVGLAFINADGKYIKTAGNTYACL